MSFAQEYLDLVTDCNEELRKIRTYQFFGVDAPWTDSAGSDIVRGSVEEWVDRESFTYTAEDGTEVEFFFDTWEDCLYNECAMPEDLNPDTFIRNYFQYEVEELEAIDSNIMFKVFTKAKETNAIVLFATMYKTSVKAKIIDMYRKKYVQLTAKYPNLPYYPNLGFGYCLEDFYESSRC